MDSRILDLGVWGFGVWGFEHSSSLKLIFPRATGAGKTYPSVELDGLGAAVETHEAGGDARDLCRRLDLAVLAELARHDKVGGQDYLDALLLGDRHDLRDDLGAVLVVR